MQLAFLPKPALGFNGIAELVGEFDDVPIITQNSVQLPELSNKGASLSHEMTLFIYFDGEIWTNGDRVSRRVETPQVWEHHHLPYIKENAFSVH